MNVLTTTWYYDSFLNHPIKSTPLVGCYIKIGDHRGRILLDLDYIELTYEDN